MSSQMAQCWFRIRAAAVVAFFVLTTVSLAQDAPPRPRFPAPIGSPSVQPDRSIVFRVRAPEATSVRFVCGDLALPREGVELTKGDEGIWELKLEPVNPGSYRYHFSINGVEVNDPANPTVSESNATSW
ncbi:MAG: hypothetical protein KDA99_20315, partial [Planctomycetales bacterium]|nr:hypothetical protein [Planctomycetales bacterium]